MLATGYTLTETTQRTNHEAVERVRGELKTQGFGVLCEIDVQVPSPAVPRHICRMRFRSGGGPFGSATGF